jgi:VWFA-related protein
MKRSALGHVLVLCGLILGLSASPAQDKPGQSVTVTLVEIPVRVLHMGEPVKGLAREDFEVYENGILQEITGFEIVSRRISPEAAVPPEALSVPAKPRLFILLFYIFDYGQTVGEGIDYFFRDVFRPGDRLMVLVEDKVLNILQDGDPATAARHLKDTLKTYKSYSTSSVIRAYSNLESEGEKLHMYLQGEGWASWYQVVNRFYENYQRTWNEYKSRFFTQDLGLFRSLTQRIRSLPGDKWVLCFEQRQMFPRLRKQSPLETEIRTLLDNQTDPQNQALARQIQSTQLALQRSMDIVQQFPGDRLKELFLQAGVTFHHIILKSSRGQDSRDFELGDVGQDYEDCFRRISVATGGAAVFSNKIAESIREASVKEDYRYVLAYTPKDKSGAVVRKIEVKVGRPGVEVFSLKQYVPAGEPVISITDFQAGQKAIRFGLRHYARIETGGRTVGSAAVRIVLFDDKSEQVFSDGKTLELIKDETNISLNFPQLASGSYFIIIDVLDRTTGGKDVHSSAIRL